MRELSYIVLQELGRCSLGTAQQVLYDNGDICVRIVIDQKTDTQQFRRLIQFLYTEQIKGLPKILRFGQIAGNTVLVVSAQTGEPLREVLQKRRISSAKLDKWWHQMREVIGLLAEHELYLGTFTPDCLMVSKADELLIPVFSLTHGRKAKASQELSQSDDLGQVEQLFISALSSKISEVDQVAESTIPPRISRFALRVESDNGDKGDTSSYSKPWVKSIRWLPTVILGVACLVSLSRGISWADSSSQSSEHAVSMTSEVGIMESPENFVTDYESLPNNQGVAVAKKILASDVNVETIDERYAEKLLTALETVRDHALNNLDYSEFMKVNVVGSPAASTESKLFHNLLDSGYHLKKYKMRFSQVEILQRNNEGLVIRAQISQSNFLRCADECSSITPEPPRLVKIALIPKPWRIREFSRES